MKKKMYKIKPDVSTLYFFLDNILFLFLFSFFFRDLKKKKSTYQFLTVRVTPPQR